jgi:UDP-N-acetylglucosamine 2-epimerase (hydrolysing)
MKKIIFVTGTRADYGKIKSLILTLQDNPNYKTHTFVTGMHNLKQFGSTYDELQLDKIKNIFRYNNQLKSNNLDLILSKTIQGFNNYVKNIKPDLIIIHGDRIEALGCALVGSLNNILTAHIEGGEVSGTIDEIIRHAVSKLSHYHFVTNKTAKKRLVQMGELNKNIFIIGSPNIEIIKSENLPSLKSVKDKYEINYENYAISIMHSDTNFLKSLKKDIKVYFQALKRSKKNFIVLYPNNDPGSEIIFNEIKKFNKTNKNFRILPSMRFEYYLTLLKNSKFIIGNSSSGIMEAPFYGIPTINLGYRQFRRAKIDSINNCNFYIDEIIGKIKYCSKINKKYKKSTFFGVGNSYRLFQKILNKDNFWKKNSNKQFQDLFFRN